MGIDNSHLAQVIGYLAVTGCPIGLLINFGERSLNYKRILPPKHITEHKVNRRLSIWYSKFFSLPFAEKFDTFESHHHNKATLKTTRYAEEQVLRKRSYLRREWCERALRRKTMKFFYYPETDSSPIQTLALANSDI